MSEEQGPPNWRVWNGAVLDAGQRCVTTAAVDKLSVDKGATEVNRIATIRLPEGYASPEEFAKDCGFELLTFTPAQGSPVAWLDKGNGTCTSNERTAKYWREQLFRELQPLYAAQPPAAPVEIPDDARATEDMTLALNARQAAINEMMAAPVETKSAIDMIAACYEGLCPDGSSALDFEWARQRGYILPNNGSGKLSPAQCSAATGDDICDLLTAYAGSRSDGFAKLAVDAVAEITRLRAVPQTLSELGELSPDEIAVVKDFRVSYERMRAYTLSRPLPLRDGGDK